MPDLGNVMKSPQVVFRCPPPMLTLFDAAAKHWKEYTTRTDWILSVLESAAREELGNDAAQKIVEDVRSKTPSRKAPPVRTQRKTAGRTTDRYTKPVASKHTDQVVRKPKLGTSE